MHEVLTQYFMILSCFSVETSEWTAMAGMCSKSSNFKNYIKNIPFQVWKWEKTKTVFYSILSLPLK